MANAWPGAGRDHKRVHDDEEEVSSPKRLAQTLRQFSLSTAATSVNPNGQGSYHRAGPRKRAHSDAMDEDESSQSKRIHEDGYEAEADQNDGSDESGCDQENDALVDALNDDDDDNNSVFPLGQPKVMSHNILPARVYNEISDNMRLAQSCYAIVPYVARERLLGLETDDQASGMETDMASDEGSEDSSDSNIERIGMLANGSSGGGSGGGDGGMEA
eukprot:m.70832 g.70832  ORF g.70832 m.70832 type:complete len:217 (+) comp14324_c0_seq1:350-1000(+)